jgi:hypothetical protein
MQLKVGGGCYRQLNFEGLINMMSLRKLYYLNQSDLGSHFRNAKRANLILAPTKPMGHIRYVLITGCTTRLHTGW